MPILRNGKVQIDYAESAPWCNSDSDLASDIDGTVILVHSSASSNRQWRSLTEALQDRYRVLAINLFGYGETSPWRESDGSQTLHAQAQLVLDLYDALCDKSRPVHLVGHSFGGSVAMKTALLMGDGVDKLVLLEPSAFFLLKQAGRAIAYQEILALRDHVKNYGDKGEWEHVAEGFVDYWLGIGCWQAMSARRKAAFVRSMPPVLCEWDAIEEETTSSAFAKLRAQTLVVSDVETQRPIREAVELMAASCPHWDFQTIRDGGHMAPIVRPDLINPIVGQFLDSCVCHDSGLTHPALADFNDEARMVHPV